MALIKCPECGKEVSENAVACPNCGSPITKQTQNTKNEGSRKSFASRFFLVIGIALIAFIVYLIVVAPSQQMTPEKSRQLLEKTEQIYKEKLEKEDEKAREYIRIIQNDYSSLRQKREAYNELIKIKEIFSNYSIEEIERMK